MQANVVVRNPLVSRLQSSNESISCGVGLLTDPIHAQERLKRDFLAHIDPEEARLPIAEPLSSGANAAIQYVIPEEVVRGEGGGFVGGAEEVRDFTTLLESIPGDLVVPRLRALLEVL